jgi:hypothetical protein
LRLVIGTTQHAVQLVSQLLYFNEQTPHLLHNPYFPCFLNDIDAHITANKPLYITTQNEEFLHKEHNIITSSLEIWQLSKIFIFLAYFSVFVPPNNVPDD